MATLLRPITWNPIRGLDDSSPQHLVSLDMSSNLLNVEIVEQGIKKRDGSSNVNDTIITATATVWQMATLNLSNGTSQELVNTSDGKVRNVAELSASVLQGFDTANPVYSEQLLDAMVYAQGITAMRTWSGSVSGIITASPKGKYLTNHLDSIWTAGIDGNLSLVSKAATGDYSTWSGAGTADINISQNDGQVVTGLKPLRGELMIYKNKSTYKLVGYNNATYQLINIDRQLGCAEHRTIQDVGGFQMFVGDDGVYMNDGNQVKKVSDYQDKIWATRNKTRSEYMDSATFPEKGEYHVSFPVGSSAQNTVTLVYYYRDIFQDQQGRLHIPCVKWSGLNMASIHMSKIGSTNEDILYYGDYSGFIKKRDDSNNDSGASIESYVDSPLIAGSSVSESVNLRRCYIPLMNNVGRVEAYYNFKEDDTSWVLAESLLGSGSSMGNEIGITFQIGISAIGISGDDSYIQRINYNGVQNNRVKIRFYQDSDIRTWQINGPIELHVKMRGHKTGA